MIKLLRACWPTIAKVSRTDTLGKLWEHDVGERLYLRRRQIAKSAGLEPDLVSPCPMVDTVMIKNPIVKQAAIAAGLFAVGCAATGVFFAQPDDALPTQVVYPSRYQITISTKDGDVLSAQELSSQFGATIEKQ